MLPLDSCRTGYGLFSSPKKYFGSDLVTYARVVLNRFRFSFIKVDQHIKKDILASFKRPKLPTRENKEE